MLVEHYFEMFELEISKFGIYSQKVYVSKITQKAVFESKNFNRRWKNEEAVVWYQSQKQKTNQFDILPKKQFWYMNTTQVLYQVNNL